MKRSEFLKYASTVIILAANGDILRASQLDPAEWAKRKVKLRFVVASDGHYGQPDTAYDLHHDEMIGWLNAEHTNRGVDFTMINGDLYHDDVQYLSQVKSKFNKLLMPYHVSHGNHDKTSEAHWSEVWNTPWHYAFEKQDAGFIVLNTANEKGDYICPDPAWTKDQLEKYRDKKHLFVFMHITPFKWTDGGLPCPEIVSLFNTQQNLKAVFHGHDHNMDNVKESGGKFYFFDSHIAGNWGTDYRGYRIVEILKSGDVVTYQMNPATNSKVNSNNV